MKKENSIRLLFKLLFMMMITCFLVVSGKHNVYAEDVPNSKESALLINVNEYYTENLSTSSDVDWYKITISKPGLLTMAIKHGIIEDSNTYWASSLYNEAGTELYNCGWEGVKTSGETYKVGVPAGTYYVKVVAGYMHSNKNYELKIGYIETENCEKETNNYKETATMINVNTYVMGNLYGSSDVDWYKITISKPGLLTMAIKHGIIEDGNTYWASSLYNKAGTELYNCGWEGVKTSGETYKVGVPAGTYYVKVVAGYMHSYKNYELKIGYIETENCEKETNGFKETATDIRANTYITGNINGSSDVDWYRIKIKKDSIVKVLFEHDYIDSNYTYWNGYLYNSQNSQLYTFGWHGNQKKENSGNLTLKKGTYYFKINCGYYISYSNYKFSLDTSELVSKGKTITISGAKYKVTRSDATNGTVEFVKLTKKSSNVSIPNTIEYKGIKYKVTSISDKAFCKDKTIKSVTIGKMLRG